MISLLKNYFRKEKFIGIFQSILLLIFLLVFFIIIFYVLSKSKKYYKEESSLPLEKIKEDKNYEI